MKISKFISVILSLTLLTTTIPSYTFAEETYEECIIPIVSDQVETYTWEGIKKDGTLYVTLEDACMLTGSEIVKQSDEYFVTERNTVKLFGNINDSACLCISECSAILFSWDGENLSFVGDGMINKQYSEQPFTFDMVFYEDEIYVDLITYAFCFGAEIDELTEETAQKAIELDTNAEKLVDFSQFESYYLIKVGTPFDEIYTEYMNRPELQFEWVDWGQELGVFASRGYDIVVNDYKNIFTQIYYSEYDSSEIYYDVLLEVLQCRPGNFDDKTLADDLKESQEEYGKWVNEVFFTADSFLAEDKVGSDMVPLIKEAKFHLEGVKVISSATTDFAQIEHRYITLVNTVSKMNDVELSLLQSSLLDETVKDEQAYNFKTPIDLANEYSHFKKIISGDPIFASFEATFTKIRKLSESYTALYDSANKLDSEIRDPNKLTQEKYKEMAENIFASVGDIVLGEAIGKFAPEAKVVLDVFDIVIKEMESDTAASVSDAAKAHFIQNTVLNNVNLDKSDASYYSLLMAMQSSYFANKNMLNVEVEVEGGKSVVLAADDTEKTFLLVKLKNLITSAYTCNRNFYNSPIGDWKLQLAEKFTGSLSGGIPDYSVSKESFEEQPLNYTWHLEPTIEAEDIIVSDDERRSDENKNEVWDIVDVKSSSIDDIEPVDECAIIKQNGKYGIIRYDGSYVAEVKYNDWHYFGTSEMAVSNYDVLHNDGIYQNTYVFSNKDDIDIVVNLEPARGAIDDYYYYDVKYNKVLDDYGYHLFDGSYNVAVEQNDGVQIGEYDEENGDYKSIHTDNFEFGTGKYGIGNKDGIVVPCEYDDACMNIGDNIIALKKNGKWGYFNQEGKQIIDFICEPFEQKVPDAFWGKYSWDNESTDYPFVSTDGYIPVKIEGKCGYYNTNGEEVIPCGTFEEVRPVHNGLVWVKKDGLWGVIRLEESGSEISSVENDDLILSDYSGTYHPVNSDFNIVMNLQVTADNHADIDITITNSTRTKVSQNIYTGNIVSSIPSFETDDGFGKNRFTIEFEDGYIRLTGKCIESYGTWGIPELNQVEMRKNVNSVETVNWKQLYAEKLNNYMNSDAYNSESMFDLLDIDNDGIPELFISDSDKYHQACCQIYCIDKKEVVELISIYTFGTVNYIKNGGYLHDSCNQGHSYENIYKKEKGSLNLIFSAYTEDGRFLGEDDAKYIVDGQTADKTHYEYERDKYYDVGSADSIEWGRGRKYKLDEVTIKEVLLNSEMTTPSKLTDEQLASIRRRLGVPDNLNVTIEQSAPSFWDAGGIWTTYVSVNYNGESIASVSVDSVALDFIKDIMMYSVEYVETQQKNQSVSDYKIVDAVNRYLNENDNISLWFDDGSPYCPAEYMNSSDTKWSCPISLSYDVYSGNEIAGFHAHWAYVDKNTLICTLTANYETVAEFDLSGYIE